MTVFEALNSWDFICDSSSYGSRVVDVLVAECWVGWWVARGGGAVDEMAVTTGSSCDEEEDQEGEEEDGSRDVNSVWIQSITLDRSKHTIWFYFIW